MAPEPDIVAHIPSGTAPAVPVVAPQRRPQRWWVNALLFAATLVSAAYSQIPGSADDTFVEALLRPLRQPSLLLQSLPFAVTLMAILLAHEMGHYLTAQRYGVDQSLPYFMPAPTLFGTFGAVIFMRSQPQSRGALLWVAVMGPFAGLMVAIPAAAWGLAHSVAVDAYAAAGMQGAIAFGDSLLFAALERLFSPNGTDVVLHPVALAGWAGLFITSLNLIPAAQLDGGHVSYALFGRRHKKLSIMVATAMLFFGLHSACLEDNGGGSMWLLWAILLLMMGLGHPPVHNPNVLLTGQQRAVGLLALGLFVLTFIPVPITILRPSAPRFDLDAPGSPGGGDAEAQPPVREDEDPAAPPDEDAAAVEEYDL